MRRLVLQRGLRTPICRLNTGRRPSSSIWPAFPAWRRESSSNDGVENGANGIQLRDYQEESIASVLDFLSKGERRLGLSLATGSGKTVIFSHLIDRVPLPKPDATQTLVLAHRRELVEQAARHCRDVYPRKSIEIDMGDVKASGSADITVASVPSIRTRLEKYDPDRFKLVIVDEAHHITAPSYAAILQWFGLAAGGDKGHVALVGVSATFSRSDGIGLGSAIDYIVYHRDYIDMIESNYLAGLIFTTVRTKVDLSHVGTSRGDFLSGALSKAVNTSETNVLTVRSWLEKAKGRSSTLVFCVDIAHAESLTEEFRRHGVNAEFITSKTRRETRAEQLRAFKNGELPVLLNCGIFTEGTDIPVIDCVVLARPTRSRNLLVQMVGRGLRKYDGKKDCHVIDMVASLETGIVTTPTLFGLDPEEVVDNTAAKDFRELGQQRTVGQEDKAALATRGAPSNGGVIADITFTDYDTVNDLIEDTSRERHIRALSPLAWVETQAGKHVLSNLNGDYLTIRQGGDGEDESSQEVLITRRLPPVAKSKSPFMAPRVLTSSSTFEAAVHAADTFAKQHFAFSYVSRQARWRERPASESQVAFLNKFRVGKEALRVGDVSAGKASDWITKLKHGAKGRFGKLEKERRREARNEQRMDKERTAEVRVGRLSPPA